MRTVMFAIAAILTSAGMACAHPHVFAEARLDVEITSAQTVKSLRHIWRFDEVFSSTVLMEFDKNSDLKLDDEELNRVSKTVFDALAEYNYYQIVTKDGKDVAMKPPAELTAKYEDGHLVILFQSDPAQFLQLSGKIYFGIYDPTFYTAINFSEDKNFVVEPLPGDCLRQVVRPDPDEAIAQNQGSLTDAFFNDPAGTDLSKIVATRFELACTAKGVGQ
ncbi:DUF1007 family protein [Pararhizobium sp. YC-54]|uniref:DUF1007 family protein n=1 Tax=Pararhizobium sp. YC-54 TaxID=2986920 RepID=UPI0021F7791F|nr:DUF1007 family protein [Pararhizobium sp. YC-54]MCW0002166.1 DUF1007 family protein [Pararhizobium sp. YC-54]